MVDIYIKSSCHKEKPCITRAAKSDMSLKFELFLKYSKVKDWNVWYKSVSYVYLVDSYRIQFCKGIRSESIKYTCGRIIINLFFADMAYVVWRKNRIKIQVRMKGNY